VSGEPTRRLASDELLALKLAAHRRLGTWVTSRLRPRQLEQRDALLRAVRVLEDLALADGCELRPTGEGERDS
jgi:hypothetical protein